MGGILQTKVEERPIAETNEAVKFACDHLLVQFGQGRQPEPQEAYQILRTLNRRLRRDQLQSTNSDGAMSINAVLVRLWYLPNFQQLVLSMFRQLMRNLELVANKNPLVIRVYEWKYLDELCELLMSLSCSKLYYALNNIEVLRNSLDEETKALLEECNPTANTTGQFDQQSMKTLFTEKLEKDELERTYKCLLLVLCEFLKLETATISRSQTTLQITERFAYSCFMLFLKLYFNHGQYNDLRKRAVKVNNEANLENASYFLGRALSEKNVALYNSTVLFTLSLLLDNRTNKHITSLPSHLFPQLPTQSTTNLYDFLFSNVLLALAYEKKEDRYERKLNCDRFYSYRLLQLLIKNGLTVFNQVSVFYLEIICRHVRSTMIERIYLTELARQAMKIRSSELLTRFAEMDNIDFQVAFSNRTITIKPSELREYLSNIGQLLCDQLDMQFQQFVSVGLLQQRQPTRDDDKIMWQMVLTRRKEHIRMTNGNF